MGRSRCGECWEWKASYEEGTMRECERLGGEGEPKKDVRRSHIEAN